MGKVVEPDDTSSTDLTGAGVRMAVGGTVLSGMESVVEQKVLDWGQVRADADGFESPKSVREC